MGDMKEMYNRMVGPSRVASFSSHLAIWKGRINEFEI